MSPEHIADLVINGHYFHDDFEKTEELNLYNSHSTILVKQEFISFVADATRIIARTGHTIKTALREGAVKT